MQNLEEGRQTTVVGSTTGAPTKGATRPLEQQRDEWSGADYLPRVVWWRERPARMSQPLWLQKADDVSALTAASLAAAQFRERKISILAPEQDAPHALRYAGRAYIVETREAAPHPDAGR